MPITIEATDTGEPIITVPGRRPTVEEMFASRPEMIKTVVERGYAIEGNRRMAVRLKLRDDGQHEILAMGGTIAQDEVKSGAIITRDPGLATDFLLSIQDLVQTAGGRAQRVQLFWNIYKNQGLVNNATNKVAGILSSTGSFKVRKAKKGKKQDAVQQLEEILFKWSQIVNAGLPVPAIGKVDQPGVITGARGLKAINHQAVRYALVEGSWVGRSTWAATDLGALGTFDLPMTIQSITTAQLEPVIQLVGTGIELFWWRPPALLLNQIRSPTTSDIGKIIKKFLPKELYNTLKKDVRVLLDPALLMHVKHRPIDTESFGESFIQPAITSIAFSESLQRLDLVSMQNLVNRLTIVMVGSSAKDSIYGDPDVVASRADLMQSFFNDTGPNMTIVWSGDDVKVEDVGAHDAVLNLNDRYTIAENKIKQALGVPEALLSGTTSDGKSAGWAAMIGASAQLEELASAFASIWTTMAERIALENGFTDVDVIFEWDQSILMDLIEERNQNRNDYAYGLLSIRSYLLATGRDPDAEFLEKCEEQGLNPDSTLWVDAFVPVQGLQGQGTGKVPGNGRTPNNQAPPANPKAKPPTPLPKEKKKLKENK